MTDTATAKAPAAKTTGTAPATVQFFKVRQTHPATMNRTVFRSVSEKRARAFLENRYPRGSEAYLETPDGDEWHYEAERSGERGTDVEPWQLFDRASWSPPDQATPPGETEWADREG